MSVIIFVLVLIVCVIGKNNIQAILYFHVNFVEYIMHLMLIVINAKRRFDMKSECALFDECKIPNSQCNDDCDLFEVKCPKCGEFCEIVPLDNSFDFAGTHCTHGQSGTNYPNDHGSPVSNCCDAPMEED